MPVYRQVDLPQVDPPLTAIRQVRRKLEFRSNKKVIVLNNHFFYVYCYIT
jgi:hypothetical protein